jgi:hypothetical protein
MRTKLSILAAIVAVGALGAGIAQAASGGRHHPAKVAAAPTRASAQVLFAVVGKKGALNRGVGAASANVVQGTAGRYTVFFKRGVRKCAYEATIGTTGFTGVPPVGEISVVAFAGHKAAVFVRTVDSTGNPEYLPFHLVVACRPL